MSKILACLDASSYAASVCDVSAWAASRLSWDVELLHVVQRKSAVTARHDLSGAIGLGVKSELLEELTRIEEAQGKLAVEGGRALLATAEERLRGAGLTNISALHMHGGIVETIIEREAEAGLVVMGKRGASSDFAAGHLGSKIERVLRASNKPLLVAPMRYTSPARAVIAYDGGQSVARAIELLTRTPLLDGLPIHLVRAGAQTQEHRTEMERAVRMFEQSGRAATFSLTQGSPERVIADSVASGPMPVLVMGAYGHSPLRNLIVGSTTTATLRAVEAPTLLVR